MLIQFGMHGGERPGELQADRRQAEIALLFGYADPLPAGIRAAYRPDINEWNGSESLQLVITHWQPDEG